MYPLYDAFAVGRALVAPLHAWGAAVRSIWSQPGPLGSATALGRSFAATGELVERATRRFAKPPFGLDATVIDGAPVAVREEIALATPFCALTRFARDTARVDPRVLVIAPLSGHHASLVRDTVAALLPEHDVYVTDWVDARLVPVSEGAFDLDDYIDLIQRFLRAIGPGAHAIAVCQPAVPALAAVALLAADRDAAVPHTLTLMGGPIDPRIGPTAPGKLATSRSLDWFDAAMVHRVPVGEPGAGRRVYPGFLQLAAFLAMNPERHTRAHLDLVRDVIAGDDAGARAHRRFYDDYLAVMDLPGEYYLQTIATVFQRHDLARGELRYRGARRVEPAAIERTALFTIEGELDDITAVGQTEAAHGLCTGIADDRRRHLVQAGAGHYGIFSGRRWRSEIAPQVRDFIRRFS
jgi:poly(3-hydroxybutyrate) depolymerase